MKIIIIVLATVVFSTAYLSAAVVTGSKAVRFTASDPDGRIITNDSIKGFVVSGFYEGRESNTKNDNLKKALNEHLKSKVNKEDNDHSPKVFKLSIVDGTPANIATKWVWKRKIKAKARENNADIFIDWDGNVKRAFEISGDDSTFIIIDKEGTIRYIMSGVIPETEFPKIFILLKNLSK